MPLFFTDVCDLLSEFEELATNDPPDLPTLRYQRQKEAVSRWFSLHEITTQKSSNLIVALLSALLPAKRTDRVYNTQYPRLVSLLKRCLFLGVDRQRMLEQWKIPGRGDLADCVERVMRQTDDPLTLAKCKVTLEEVDTALANLASKSRFSGANVKERKNDMQIQASLETIYRRLHSGEAKWLTRMILKDFTRLDIEVNVVYGALDARFPDVMKMHDNLESAVTALKNLPAPQSGDNHRCAWITYHASGRCLLPPQVGVKVGSPKWVKAKGGVKHALSIIDGRTMSVERKHDGEYCQIHIDLSKGEDCVQIFSKSGKDSTIDRIGLHDAIGEGLRIGRNDCKFSKKCIVEGELLVWCDKTDAVLDFHKIRKHVSRSGSFLGTEKDSQPHPWEHLMIVFYDVLLIDDDPVIFQIYEQRRQHLKRLVRRVVGKADVVERKAIDFSRLDGVRGLKKYLAEAFVKRWEGLVLKPANEPYFDSGGPRRGRHPAQWLKLKKDCIKGLGDTADLAVIGAGYEPKAAARLKIPNLSWTHFFIACLTNKENVIRGNAKPSMFVFDCVQDGVKTEDLKAINQHGRFMEMKPGSNEAVETFCLSFAWMNPAQPKVSAIFKQPFVFEVAGSGFDKTPNCDFFALRFPRVVKIHWDRDWRQSVCLEELQQIATIARTISSGQDLEQELLGWMEKLDNLDRRTSGRMASWDCTDDEEELQSITEDAVPVLVAPKSAHNPRIHLRSPFALTDSSEMAPNERRQVDDETIQNPASAPSITNAVSESDSPTFSITTSGMEKKKRMIEYSDLTKHDRILKKARLFKSEPTRSMDKTAAKLRRPLQDIMNPTRLTRGKGPENNVQRQKASSGGLNLVSRMATGADKLVHERHLATKSRTVKSFSPARDTTASACSSTTTSQPTVLHEGCPSRPNSGLGAFSHLPTPRNTNEAFIPDLEDCQIVLSPCLMSKMPEQLSHLLRELSKPIRSLLPNETSQEICRLAPTATNGVQIIFLVDANNTTKATASSLHKLAFYLNTSYPLPVHVFDWHIVAVARQLGSENTRSREEMADNLRIAKMSWVPPYGNDESTVLVQWADGETTKELLDTFVKLEHLLTM